MSVSATAPATTSVSTATQNKLVKMANGEYTADSVSKDQTDANKLGLTKQKDGNYGTQSAQATTSAAAKSTAGVQSALLALTLGGS